MRCAVSSCCGCEEHTYKQEHSCGPREVTDVVAVGARR